MQQLLSSIHHCRHPVQPGSGTSSWPPKKTPHPWRPCQATNPPSPTKSPLLPEIGLFFSSSSSPAAGWLVAFFLVLPLHSPSIDHSYLVKHPSHTERDTHPLWLPRHPPLPSLSRRRRRRQETPLVLYRCAIPRDIALHRATSPPLPPQICTSAGRISKKKKKLMIWLISDDKARFFSSVTLFYHLVTNHGEFVCLLLL